jgi:two-component system, sensor histidine kinase and response regulator
LISERFLIVQRLLTATIFYPVSYRFHRFLQYIHSIGITSEMSEYEKRKISIFNMLNLLGLATGVLVPFLAILSNNALPPLAWFAAFSPVCISITVLWMVHERYYELSRVCYFCLYPLATSLAYLGGVNVGIELFFILYGVLSVLFLHTFRNIVLSFCLSSFCYYLSALVMRHYYFDLKHVNYGFYLINHFSALLLIFYALYLIKKENSIYQFKLVNKGDELLRQNREIESQKQQIGEKAMLLESQTKELAELNQVKNKLFSVIAHDLKTPMYALRNLFSNMQQQDMPANEIRELIPGIINEMNFATSLMENLLVWARDQMKNASAQPDQLNIPGMTDEVFKLLRLQAVSKQIKLVNNLDEMVSCYADREMVYLVLRNLLSNAIKFTPQGGTVSVSASAQAGKVTIHVKDTGVGMSEENKRQLFNNDYFTTRGTNDESGTGIGLLLCRDFLEKNNGAIYVTSQRGKGSTFSFVLPASHND